MPVGQAFIQFPQRTQRILKIFSGDEAGGLKKVAGADFSISGRKMPASNPVPVAINTLLPKPLSAGTGFLVPVFFKIHLLTLAASSKRAPSGQTFPHHTPGKKR